MRMREYLRAGRCRAVLGWQEKNQLISPDGTNMTDTGSGQSLQPRLASFLIINQLSPGLILIIDSGRMTDTVCPTVVTALVSD